MLINLTEILSREGKTQQYVVDIEMDAFKCKLGEYPISNRDHVTVSITNMGQRKLRVEAVSKVTLDIPCARCLETVKSDIEIEISKDIDMSESGAESREESGEKSYVEGYNLNVDELVYDEILLNLPMKVLCKPNCKGICNRCGMNLNYGECGCDRESLDPRRSVIRDIFNNFKEV